MPIDVWHMWTDFQNFHQLIRKKIFYVYTSQRFPPRLQYFMKVENPKMLLILTAFMRTLLRT